MHFAILTEFCAVNIRFSFSGLSGKTASLSPGHSISIDLVQTFPSYVEPIEGGGFDPTERSLELPAAEQAGGGGGGGGAPNPVTAVVVADADCLEATVTPFSVLLTPGKSFINDALAGTTVGGREPPGRRVGRCMGAREAGGGGGGAGGGGRGCWRFPGTGHVSCFNIGSAFIGTAPSPLIVAGISCLTSSSIRRSTLFNVERELHGSVAAFSGWENILICCELPNNPAACGKFKGFRCNV